MHIAKSYISPSAQMLLSTNPNAQHALQEISDSITSMTNCINNTFTINCSSKNCNGVVPIKEKCYICLENTYNWYREKPLKSFPSKGGPIDVYKEFSSNTHPFNVGLEFETGNISSAHRSMNKLSLALQTNELQLAVIILPVHKLSYYLTDRVSNYEELEPYFALLHDRAFIVLGFDAESYSANAPLLPKGRDGMSTRSIRKWKN